MKHEDYLEMLAAHALGALDQTDRRLIEDHLAECPACAELAKDSAGAVAFMERAAMVEPPAELVTRIMFEIPAARSAVHSTSGSLWTNAET